MLDFTKAINEEKWIAEGYNALYTIEANGSKGWEVIWTSESYGTGIENGRAGMFAAMEIFKQTVMKSDGTQYRLTTPDSDTQFETLGL